MTKFFRHYFQSTNSPFGDFTNTSPPVAAEIFGKLKAMEHYASPPSSLIWLWLFVSFGEPLVTFVTALSEGRSDHRKEHSFRCSIIVHYSRHFTTSVSGVQVNHFSVTKRVIYKLLVDCFQIAFQPHRYTWLSTFLLGMYDLRTYRT